MANVTYTFTAGTKAKSAEVNKNFDDCITAINQNASNISTLTTSVNTLSSGKANKNGSTTERFSVANPTTSYEAVNKQYLESYTSFINDYIQGYTITKSTSDTIIVSAGDCLDSTHVIHITKTDSTTKQNDTQSASTTYYVYVICKEDGSEVDVLISTSSSSPSLPTDYEYYRQIGNYVTNSSNVIVFIGSTNGADTIKANQQQIASLISPDYSSGISVSSGWVATNNGWIYCFGATAEGTRVQWSINSKAVYINNQTDAGSRGGSLKTGSMAFIRANETLTVSASSGDYSATFYPCKGL